ncbi:MAG: hypothetical protein RXO54_06630 [Acidilobus sp.]
MKSLGGYLNLVPPSGLRGCAHVQEQAATPGTDAPRLVASPDLRGSLR